MFIQVEKKKKKIRTNYPQVSNAQYRTLIDKLKKYYQKYGASKTLLKYLLIKGEPATLSELFRLHQKVAGVTSDNSTRKALDNLIKKGLVEKIGRGVYKATSEAEEYSKNAFDLKRIRTRGQVLKRSGVSRKKPKSVPKKTKRYHNAMQRKIKKVIERAEELMNEDKAKAVSLLAHTLLPVRWTGVLLGRKNDLFFYYEPKDKTVHMLKSSKLREIFDSLGIENGSLTYHIKADVDEEIHKFFKGYKKARNPHYYIKKFMNWLEPIEGYFFYDYDPGKNILFINQNSTPLFHFNNVDLDYYDERARKMREEFEKKRREALKKKGKLSEKEEFKELLEEKRAGIVITNPIAIGTTEGEPRHGPIIKEEHINPENELFYFD